MRRLALSGLGFLLLLSAPFFACAQGVITTIAGTDWTFRGDGGPALNAPLGTIGGMAVDSGGNIFAADTENNLVVRVSPTVFVGLYQVNVEVPAGVPAGSEVPLVLIQNGVTSNTVTLAIR